MKTAPDNNVEDISMIPSIENLKLLTKEFFSRHWNEAIIAPPGQI